MTVNLTYFQSLQGFLETINTRLAPESLPPDWQGKARQAVENHCLQVQTMVQKTQELNQSAWNSCAALNQAG